MKTIVVYKHPKTMHEHVAMKVVENEVKTLYGNSPVRVFEGTQLCYRMYPVGSEYVVIAESKDLVCKHTGTKEECEEFMDLASFSGPSTIVEDWFMDLFMSHILGEYNELKDMTVIIKDQGQVTEVYHKDGWKVTRIVDDPNYRITFQYSKITMKEFINTVAVKMIAPEEC